MKKVCIIIPYFGSLPEWFDLFLYSCSKSNICDFVLLTDDQRPFNYPDNFTVSYTSFAAIQKKFRDKLGQHIYIDIPYKLCDYKPAYGFVFDDLIQGYGYWGYCDIDLIFGDIDAYLNKLNYNQYDRLFPLGHLTLYRNSIKVNTLFKDHNLDNLPALINIDYVTRTTYPCNFDEIGMNYIVEKVGLSYCKQVVCKNVNVSFRNFLVDGGQWDFPELIYYKQGKIFVSRLSDGLVEEQEIMYVHFQSRKNIKVDPAIGDSFLINDQGFIALDTTNINDYFEVYAKPVSEESQNEYAATFQTNNKKAQKVKLKRELSTYGFKGLVNIYKRYQSLKFINSNRFY